MPSKDHLPHIPANNIHARLVRRLNASGLDQTTINDLATDITLLKESSHSEGLATGRIEGKEKGYQAATDKVMLYCQNLILQGAS
ncbi:MAG: hypothetical protein OEV73_00360 [Desulfobulbaceae bacterium]|nr:hypothetical protein [Desulfobulbaceae bacterium]